MLVDGVGEKVAWYVSLYGQIVDRCGGTIQTKKKAKGGVSYFQNIETVKSFFEQTYLESCVIILYDINYKIITSLQFNDKSASFVKGDIPELVSAITTTQAKYLLIAHNHLSGNPEPSESDDVATLKILGLAGYHGVEVLDHIIVTKGDSYSYYYSGKLEKIKAQTDLSKVVKIDE